MSVGIDAVKAALVATDEVGLVAVKAFRDGFQIGDFVTFYEAFTKNEEFKAALQKAWELHNQILEQVADIDLAEAIELVYTEIAYVPKFIAALKG